MGSDNKRISKRAPVVLRIKLRYTSVDSFVQKFATNLSPGGMFISSRAPKPVGTTVKFELRLADESAVINGSGIVRWTQEYDPEHPRRLFGMGIEFTQLAEESRAIIERIVEHKRSLGLPDDDEIPMSDRRDPPPTRAMPADTPAEPPEPAPAAPTPRPRRPAVPVEELIARATSASDDDFLSTIDAELPNLSTTLARARQLAGSASDGGELDALLKVTASPVARSVDDASSALATILGGAGVHARRARPSNGRAQADAQPAPDDPASDDPALDSPPSAEAAQADHATPADDTTADDPAPAADATPADATPADDAVRAAESLVNDAVETPPPAPPTEPTLDAPVDDVLAGLGDEPAPAPARSSIEARRPNLAPAPLPGMPPDAPELPAEAPTLDASAVTDTSSSGSIDLTDLADQLFTEGGADALSHDLDADALDAEALLASGVDQLITPRQRRKSEPANLRDAPDLSSFADPPTMTGADPMPGARPPPPPPPGARSHPPPDTSLEDLDAALAALDVEPVPSHQPGAPPPVRAPASDFDADEQPLLTRADGPPLGMMPPPLPHVRASRSEPPAPIDDEETDLGDFDVDIDLEADYDSFEAEPPQEVDPDASLDTDDEEAKKKGIFSRMFGRKK